MNFFDAERHEYTSGGVIVPSVTELCRFFHHKAEYADKTARDTAAIKGTAVHELAALIDYGEEVNAPCEIAGYLMAWLAFVRDFDFRPEYIERVLFGEKFAGTLDVMGTICGNIPCIIDRKTGSTVNKMALLGQLNGYRELLAENGDTKEYKQIAVFLKGDGTYKYYDVPHDKRIIPLLLEMHDYETKNKKRWRKTV